MYIPDTLSVFRWVVVLLLTFLAHNYDRHCRRLQLKRDLHIPRTDLPVDEKMRDMLKEVKEHLAWIDHPWISSFVMNIFMLSKVLDTESKLVRLFSDCTQQELNYLVTHSLALLMYKMKDHRWVKKYYRTKFIETLAERRICELTVTSRCILVDALQSMKLSAHPKAELYVKNIFLKTFGDNLSQLKSLSDSKGDFQSMHKLIYFDIRSKEVRAAILDHIKTQARVQKAHMRLGTSQSRRRGEFAWRKILSDVDDTLLCSGGAYPAGIDRSLPRKTLYPGVLSFYRELDLGDTGPDIWDPHRTGNLVFLSARPHLYSDLAERHVYDSLNNLQLTRGLYTSPSLLCGSMKTGAQYMLNNTMEPLAQKKMESFKEYAALYAEFEFVFIGDNGQGDVRAAELIHEDSLYRGNLKRAYMRKVKPLSETHCKNEATSSPDCPFICYFTTYVEAAIDAFEHDLIRIGGLRQVAIESVMEFENIDWGLFGNKRNDANLQSPRASAFASNQNLSGGSGSGSGGVMNKRAAPKTQRVALRESFRKRYMRLLELNASLSQANVLLVQNGLQSVALLKFECLYKRGTHVSTPFGPGVVEWFRPHDGTYEVLLQIGLGDCEEKLLRSASHRSNMAFLRSDSLLPFRRSSSSWVPASLRGSRSHTTFASASSANRSLREQIKTIKHSAGAGLNSAEKRAVEVKLDKGVVDAAAGTEDINGKTPLGGELRQQPQEEVHLTHKWIVWTPFGLGILLPDVVSPPPPPLEPVIPPPTTRSGSEEDKNKSSTSRTRTGSSSSSINVKDKGKGRTSAATVHMVKVKTQWGAVMSISKSEVVKMKVISVTVPASPQIAPVSAPASSPASPLLLTPTKTDNDDHHSHRSLSDARPSSAWAGNGSCDEGELPLELRALLSPPRSGSRRRALSGPVSTLSSGSTMNGSEDVFSSEDSGGSSLVGGLYKRFFGSREAEKKRNVDHELETSGGAGPEIESCAGVEEGEGSREDGRLYSEAPGGSAVLVAERVSGMSISSLHSCSGSSGGELVQQRGEDEGCDDEDGYCHDLGLSIDDAPEEGEGAGAEVSSPSYPLASSIVSSPLPAD